LHTNPVAVTTTGGRTIYRWGWGFSTSQDFDGDIALIACFASSWTRAALEVVTERAPTPAELADLRFAFAVCKHVKSNAVVFARGGATVGIGAGQISRLERRDRRAQGGRDRHSGRRGPGHGGQRGVASDAFFPFADGLEAALAAGATAVIQPGGSMRDAEVIAAANRAGAAMVFTGRRHFRH
jgi:phosphoribosylaminoimidazolecarboxamide formyltransferase / IMP cyclohydrolase